MHHISVHDSMKMTADREATLRAFSLMVVILALLFLVPHSAQAAAGALDSRFGNGGVVATDFAQTDDYAFGIAVQPWRATTETDTSTQPSARAAK